MNKQIKSKKEESLIIKERLCSYMRKLFLLRFDPLKKGSKNGNVPIQFKSSALFEGIQILWRSELSFLLAYSYTLRHINGFKL